MWEVVAYLAICGVFALLISAVSALVWGPGAVSDLTRRLSNAENRIEDVDGRITSEVKKRAAAASVESRSKARTDAEITAEATQAMADPYAAPDVSQGRVRTSGVFPVTARKRS